VICHGIPDSRAMLDGDIMNLDVTAYIGGVHGDTNATFFVGDVDQQSRDLVRVTEECTWKGIEAVRPAPSATSTVHQNMLLPTQVWCGVRRADRDIPPVLQVPPSD
jgi:Xaa-Pro aminopeptidase